MFGLFGNKVKDEHHVDTKTVSNNNKKGDMTTKSSSDLYMIDLKMEPYSDTIDLSKTALLIIDMQVNINE